MSKEYCYLMYDGKYYKIGKSIHPQKRLKQLKTANPSIEIVAISKIVAEKDIHCLYKNKNITLEWFDLTYEDVDEIKLLFKNGKANIKLKQIEEAKLKQKEQTELKIKEERERKIFEEEEIKLNLLKSKKYTLIEMMDIEDEQLKLFHLNKWIDLHNKKEKSELDIKVEETIKENHMFINDVKNKLKNKLNISDDFFKDDFFKDYKFEFKYID